MRPHPQAGRHPVAAHQLLRSENAFTDPTHKRFCTERTFEYWVKGTEFNSFYGPAYARNGIEFEYVQGYPRLEGTELAVKMRRI